MSAKIDYFIELSYGFLRPVLSIVPSKALIAYCYLFLDDEVLTIVEVEDTSQACADQEQAGQIRTGHEQVDQTCAVQGEGIDRTIVNKYIEVVMIAIDNNDYDIDIFIIFLMMIMMLLITVIIIMILMMIMIIIIKTMIIMKMIINNRLKNIIYSYLYFICF